MRKIDKQFLTRGCVGRPRAVSIRDAYTIRMFYRTLMKWKNYPSIEDGPRINYTEANKGYIDFEKAKYKQRNAANSLWEIEFTLARLNSKRIIAMLAGLSGVKERVIVDVLKRSGAYRKDPALTRNINKLRRIMKQSST